MVAHQHRQAKLQGFVDHQTPGFSLPRREHQPIGQGVEAAQFRLVAETHKAATPRQQPLGLLLKLLTQHPIPHHDQPEAGALGRLQPFQTSHEQGRVLHGRDLAAPQQHQPLLRQIKGPPQSWAAWPPVRHLGGEKIHIHGIGHRRPPGGRHPQALEVVIGIGTDGEDMLEHPVPTPEANILQQRLERRSRKGPIGAIGPQQQALAPQPQQQGGDRDECRRVGEHQHRIGPEGPDPRHGPAGQREGLAPVGEGRQGNAGDHPMGEAFRRRTVPGEGHSEIRIQAGAKAMVTAENHQQFHSLPLRQGLKHRFEVLNRMGDQHSKTQRTRPPAGPDPLRHSSPSSSAGTHGRQSQSAMAAAARR